MASYSYPPNTLPASQDPQQFSNFNQSNFGNFPPPAANQQWNQPNAFPNFDQQNAYVNQSQFNNFPAADNSYGQGMKKNDNYGNRGNQNFRGAPGNRNSGPSNFKGSKSGYGNSGMEEQQDTIFVSGLSEDTTENQLQEHFGSIGLIKMDKKTRRPKIWVYKDKETGKSKGECTITYDDPPTASSAISWFNGKEFNGRILKIELAQRKNSYLASGNNSGGGGGGRSFGNRGNDNRNRNDRGGDRDFDKGERQSNSRQGDWQCPSCKNNNFAWRNSCNRCKTEKPNDNSNSSSNYGSDRRSSNLPYERRGGSSNDRNDNRSDNRNDNRNNRNGGNRDRGSFGGQRNNDRFRNNGGNNSGPMRGNSNNNRRNPY